MIKSAKSNSSLPFSGMRIKKYAAITALLSVLVIPFVIIVATSRSYILNLTHFNTALFSTLALLIGIVGYERLRVFPGIISGSYIFMSFSASFAAIATIPLLMRVEYSGVQFLSTYIASLSIYLYIHQKLVAHHRMRIGVIPSNHTSQLPDIYNIEWVYLDFEQEVSKKSVEIVVADLHENHSSTWNEYITHVVMSGTPVYHYKQILEQTTGRVEVNHLSENTLGSLNPNDFYLKVKSTVDALIATALLIVLAPVILIVALLVRLDTPGPALFRQVRTGYRTRPFTLYKIRTMRIAPDAASDAERRDAAMTKVGDPRITRLGAFLRRSRLDELPQLINIVKGEMSLIGPRPEALALSQWYGQEIPFYHYRHIIKPGVTGWAQINQGHVVDVSDIKEKLNLDFYYVKNFSFWLDVLICIRTIRTMITGQGAR